MWLDPEILGYQPGCPGIKRLRAAVDAGEINLIICQLLDELGIVDKA